MTGRMLLIVLAGLIVSTMYLNLTLNENEALENFIAYYNRAKAIELAYNGFNIAKNKIYFNNTRNSFLSNPPTYNMGGGTITYNIQPDNTSGWARTKVTVTATYPASGSDQREYQIIFWFSPTRMNEFLMFLNQDGRKGDPFWFPHETADGPVHSNRSINILTASGKPKFWGGLTVQIPGNGTETSRKIDDGRGNTIVVNEKDFGFGDGNYLNSNLNIKNSIDLKGEYNENVFHKMNMKFETGNITPRLSANDQFPNWNRDYKFKKSEKGTAKDHYIKTKKQVHLKFYVKNGKTYYRMFTDVRGNANADKNSIQYYGDFSNNDPEYEVPSNGVLLFEGFDVFVQGTYKGALTVISKEKELNGQKMGGNIIIREKFVAESSDQLRYSSQVNTGIKDIAGLFAENNCVVGSYFNGERENYAEAIDNKKDVNSFKVDASVITLNGCWATINPDSRKYTRLSVYGSIASEERGIVGYGDGVGCFKFYRYDKRFKTMFPPLMPATDKNTISAVLMRTLK